MLADYLATILNVQDKCPDVLGLTLHFSEKDGVLHRPGYCDAGKALVRLDLEGSYARREDFCLECTRNAHFGRTHANKIAKTVKHYDGLLTRIDLMDVSDQDIFSNFELVELACSSAANPLQQQLATLGPLRRELLEKAQDKRSLLLKRVRHEINFSVLYPIALELMSMAPTFPPQYASEELTNQLLALQKSAQEAMARELASNPSWSLVFVPPSFDTPAGPAYLKQQRIPVLDQFRLLLEATRVKRDVYLMPAAAAAYAMRFNYAPQGLKFYEFSVGIDPDRAAAEVAAVLFEPVDPNSAYRTLETAYQAGQAV